MGGVPGTESSYTFVPLQQTPAASQVSWTEAGQPKITLPDGRQLKLTWIKIGDEWVKASTQSKDTLMRIALQFAEAFSKERAEVIPKTAFAAKLTPSLNDGVSQLSIHLLSSPHSAASSEPQDMQQALQTYINNLTKKTKSTEEFVSEESLAKTSSEKILHQLDVINENYNNLAEFVRDNPDLESLYPNEFDQLVQLKQTLNSFRDQMMDALKEKGAVPTASSTRANAVPLLGMKFIKDEFTRQKEIVEHQNKSIQSYFGISMGDWQGAATSAEGAATMLQTLIDDLDQQINNPQTAPLQKKEMKKLRLDLIELQEKAHLISQTATDKLETIEKEKINNPTTRSKFSLNSAEKTEHKKVWDGFTKFYAKQKLELI